MIMQKIMIVIELTIVVMVLVLLMESGDDNIQY